MSIRYKNNLIRRVYKTYQGGSTVYANDITHVYVGSQEYFPGTWQFYYWLDDTNGIYHISSTKISDNYLVVTKSIRHDVIFDYSQRLPRIDDSSIQMVLFDNVVKPYYTDWWFNECSATAYENLSNLDLSLCSSTAYMFCQAKITSIDLSMLNTSSIRFFNYMFRNSNLTSIDMTGWDTSKGEDFTGMFEGCLLTSIDINSWNMSNAKKITYMFHNCTGLTKIEIPDWDVSNLVQASGLFYNCSNVYLINLKNWTPINLVRASDLFNNCQYLNNLTMWDVDQTPKLAWVDSMFHHCTRMTQIDARFIKAANLTNYTPQNCFFGCTNLATIYCNESWSSLSTVASDCEIFGECSSKLTGGGGNSWPDCGITVAAANTWGYFRTKV